MTTSKLEWFTLCGLQAEGESSSQGDHFFFSKIGGATRFIAKNRKVFSDARRNPPPSPAAPLIFSFFFYRFQYTSLDEEDADKPRECQNPDCLITVSGVSIECSTPNWTLPPGTTPVPTMAPPESTPAPVQGEGVSSSNGVRVLQIVDHLLTTAVEVYPPVIIVTVTYIYIKIPCSFGESPTILRKV